jgi:formylmethanofuran dehydrogenase subunit E
MTKPNELTATIEFARKLQGHVGPYLVIGLKMGAAAKKALNISDTESTHLS